MSTTVNMYTMETETPTAEDIQLLKKTVESKASQVRLFTDRYISPSVSHPICSSLRAWRTWRKTRSWWEGSRSCHRMCTPSKLSKLTRELRSTWQPTRRLSDQEEGPCLAWPCPPCRGGTWGLIGTQLPLRSINQKPTSSLLIPGGWNQIRHCVRPQSCDDYIISFMLH